MPRSHGSCHDIGRHVVSCSLLIILPVNVSRLPKRETIINPEYDFADDNEASNDKQADDQSMGDHEYSDGEGIQGPPPSAEFKSLWDFEKLEAVVYQKTTASQKSKHKDFR